MSSLLTMLLIAFTSVGAVGFGVGSAYGVVLAILQAVSYHFSPSPAGARPLVLVANETHASGD